MEAKPVDSEFNTDVEATSPNSTSPEGTGLLKLLEMTVVVGSFFIFIIFLPLSLFFCIRVVQQYERAVIFRLGHLRPGARGPGIFFFLPCIDDFFALDLRTITFDVPTQKLLTKDSVTTSVDAVVYYSIANPLSAIINVIDYRFSTQLLAVAILRNVLGTKSLSEILSERDAIAHTMQITLKEATSPWGVMVERVEIKDVCLPIEMQRAMAVEAEATRTARAKVIAAEGELKASRALREASDVIAQNPAALQLRYLQTMNTISAEKRTTIIFPLPIEILGPYINSQKNENKSQCGI